MKTRAELVAAGKHVCHWPTCNRACPPAMWGCKEHWFRLPKILRDEIWATYRPGQEVTKDPSEAYLNAAYAIDRWIALEIKEGRASRFMNAADLKAIVDPALKALQATVRERGAVIVMVAAPDGKHDSYYVAWAGSCLMAKGLREQGNEKLQELIHFKESV